MTNSVGAGDLRETDGLTVANLTNHFQGTKPTLIVTHGILSDAEGVSPLAKALESLGYSTLVFGYSWLRPIHEIVDQLHHDLFIAPDAATVDRIRRNGIFLIGHSLGGVVLRAFGCRDDVMPYVKGIAMLGAPNSGVFTKGWEWVLRELAVYLKPKGPPVTPIGKLISSTAIQQLLRGDEYLHGLNGDLSRLERPPRMLSISGNKRALDFRPNLPPITRNTGINLALNTWIKLAIGTDAMGNERDYDGLVPDISVNLSSYISRSAAHSYKHEHKYPTYDNVDHRNIKDHPDVTTAVQRWIERPWAPLFDP